MRSWLAERTPRERAFLALGAAAAAALVFHLAVWAPLGKARAAAAHRLALRAQTLARMEAMAAEIRALRARTPAHDGEALLPAVERSAREAGLGAHVTRLRPEGETAVEVELADAPFDALVSWLATLEARHGLVAARLGVGRGEAPGRVSARLRLERPA
ncbi:type II secretion system protein GspM [Inmirania thermothiophila]|uniref:Type II secretion system protein M n=1 Tax=Inmirania thermothiophila TaxID=1750597 RepID=A0A3N1XWJ3_9GAMM|nr:type II secretion system protein GspM [Inmirania thermothiophila]ROR29562.1 general secretion pathway protein M [Inmirania thermothiophila]